MMAKRTGKNALPSRHADATIPIIQPCHRYRRASRVSREPRSKEFLLKEMQNTNDGKKARQAFISASLSKVKQQPNRNTEAMRDKSICEDCIVVDVGKFISRAEGIIAPGDNSVGTTEIKEEEEQITPRVKFAQEANKSREAQNPGRCQSLPSVGPESQQPDLCLSPGSPRRTPAITHPQSTIRRMSAPKVPCTDQILSWHMNSSSFLIPPRPLAVIITDSGVKSALPLPDVRSLWDIFFRNVRVIIECTNRDMIYDVNVLMRTSSPIFFSWYEEEAVLPVAATALTLKLVNIDGQALQVFRIFRWNLTYFLLIKQHIWDIFWASSNFGSDYLRIYVTESNNVPGGFASQLN